MALLIFLSFLVKSSIADWVLIGSSFTGTAYQTNGWGGQFNVSQCNTNPLTYVKIGYYGWYYQKEFYFRSFQQIIMFDLYYDDANSTTKSAMKGDFYDYTTASWYNIQYFEYVQSDLGQQSNRICTGGSDYAYNYNTQVSTTNLNTDRFKIVLSCSRNYDDRDYLTVGLRNVLIYANMCHPRCLTCSGSNDNQCLTCYYRTPFSGQCNCHPEHQFAMQLVGCIQECPRTYYIPNQNKNCIVDKRIIAENQYFLPTQTLSSLYDPFIFIPDSLHISTKGPISRECNYQYDYVGQLQFNEGLSLQMNTRNALKFIRLRVTFIFFLQTDSSITIYSDSIQQSQVKKTNTDFYLINSTSIFTQIGNTVECNEIIVRLETIFRPNTLNPLIQLKGSLNSLGEYWGFFNVTIDVGICQENCQLCSDFSKCSQCVTGYVVYQDKCIVSCPIYSTNCIDYSDEYPNSRYLAKGFYDLTMTMEEITFLIDSVTNSGTNFKTGQMFSFFPDKFVMGGPMVWFDASYIKQFSISQPHYAISIRFNFTFGDQYPGQFTYYLDTIPYGPFTIPSSSGQNQVGKSNDEITQFFYTYLNPHTSNTLDIEFKCQAPALFDIRDGFCAISDYFIVVHYVLIINNQCPPFCVTCSSSTVCISWYSGYTSSTCASNEYLSYDETTQTFSYKSCNPTTCSLSSLFENKCIDCTYLNTPPPLHSYLADSTYHSCSKYCQECFGPSQSHCLSCDSYSNRIFQNSKCACQTGYYDDGINVQCYPICGDGVTTISEDCDDGNFNPHDGCDMCKFSCDIECEECTLGICWWCIQGYQLLQNHCFPICNDNLQVTSEQCEDSNLTPYDGCFNCNYSCSVNCINCIQGVCQQCDEAQGWYLQMDNSCQPLCGDNIVVIPYEICDNQSNFIFDECFQCQYKCSQYCSVCVQGQCIICDSGYELVSKINQCVPICGDYIRLQPQVCDDDNNLPDDGCYNCESNCQSSCTDCTIYGCLECNTQGWMLNSITQKCETICGDGIIVQDYEECDDAISEKCYQCKYICQVSCQYCYHGNCKLCQKGWYLNEIDEYCYKQSGDSLVLGMEQCDDSNNIDFDGCYLSKNSCQQSCKLCQFGKCQNCKIEYSNIEGSCFEIHNDGVLVESEQCDDANLVPFDGCRDSKYDCPQFCSSCVKGQCLECKKGYGQFDWHHNQCLSICGDKIVAVDEECDDGNQISYDGCNQCKYSCPLECSKCERGKCEVCKEGYYINKKINECVSYCGDLIIRQNEECDDLSKGCIDCKYVCDELCENCINGKCFNCFEKGLQPNPITGSCQPICGDGVIMGQEQCDDANNIREDGCHECYFECQKACTKCVEGFCQECDTIGWELKGNHCVPICGDKYVVTDYEECDDGNKIPYDGCFDCRYQCEEQCTDCKKGICQACNNLGWAINNHICFVNCGDSYVVPDLEQCDDGNDIEFDGCFQCQYSCDKLCTSCTLGVCYECDHLGWIIENHRCIPYCGDGLILGYEQCDDQNTDESDGCDNCTFSCDQYCTECQAGVCLQCETGRQVEFNICQPICGDGYLVEAGEQCDDGNDENGDGCDYKCKVEDDWVCLINQANQSICFYSQQPKFELQLITQNPEDVEEVRVIFSQKMQLSSPISDQTLDFIVVDIQNLENSGFVINKSFENIPQMNEPIDVVIFININFIFPIDNPVLTIKFVDDPLVSEYNLTLKQNEGSLQLLTPIVLSQTQKAAAESTQAFNQAVIYTLVGLSSICVLTGSSDLFWNLMDQLQYLSYIKYINIAFPSNLNIYYEVFKLVTISPLLSKLGIDKIFDLVDGDKTYYVAPQYKFLKDELNAYFYINFQSFLFVLIGGFIGYWITKYTTIFLYQFGPYYCSYLNFKFSKVIYQFRKILKVKVKQFYFNGLIRIAMANCYDISFACAFQLANYQNDDTVLIINYYLAAIALIIQAGVSLIFVGIMNDFLNKTTYKKKQQYEALFEGVQETKTPWIIQYNSLLLIKKQIFIFLIVFMQKDGQIQTLCIAFLQTIFLTYFIISKPLTNPFEFYKSLITECLIIFNTITFLIYSYLDDLSLTLQDRINLGWIHIFTSTMILAISLIFDVIQQGKILIQKIQQNYFQEPKIDIKKSNVVFFY